MKYCCTLKKCLFYALFVKYFSSPLLCVICEIFQFPLIIPIFFLLCVLFLLILPLTVEPESTGMALVMILVGVPVYLIFVKWKNKPKSWNNFFGEF